MAFRATAHWTTMLSRLGGSRSFATSSSPSSSYKKFSLTGEFAPLYMVMGMVMVALTIAGHTAKQQLMHCPNVSISKRKRGTVHEVEDPDRLVTSSDKFLNQSFLRKVAHIQEHKRTLQDPVRPDPYAWSLLLEATEHEVQSHSMVKAAIDGKPITLFLRRKGVSNCK